MSGAEGTTPNPIPQMNAIAVGGAVASAEGGGDTGSAALLAETKSDDRDEMFLPDADDIAFIERELAKDAAIVNASDELGFLMFDPRRGTMISWASMTAVCIVYNVVYGPIQVAFRIESHWTLSRFDDFCDMVFILDVLLTFRTCIVHVVHGHEELIVDRSVIALDYLEGFFVIDIMSIGIPFGMGEQSRALDVMRMAKVLRLIKLNQLISRLWTPPPHVAKLYVLTKMLVLLIVAAHIFGCFYWMFFTDEDGIPLEESWIMAKEHYFPGNATAVPPVPPDYFSMYMPGLYFSLMTLTTVGYGDIHATTPMEMVFVSALMLVGAVLYAIVLGITTSVLMSVVNCDEVLMNRMEVVDTFFDKFELDNKTRSHVIKTLKLQWTLAQSFEIEEPLKQLPRQLFKQVMLTWHRPLLLEVPFFAIADSDFLAEVVCALQMQVCLKGNQVISEGEIGKNLYFLGHGSGHSTAANGELALEVFQPGSYFGETEVLFQCCRRVWSVEMTANSELYKLEQEDLRALLGNFPDVGLAMHKAAKARLSNDINKLVNWCSSRKAAGQEQLKLWNTMLLVRVNEARIAPELGNVDSYCLVRVGNIYQDWTPTEYNTNNPIWKTKVFSFKLDRHLCEGSGLFQKDISFCVFDRGTFRNDVLLGNADIPLAAVKQLINQPKIPAHEGKRTKPPTFKQWVNLKSPTGKISQIHLQIWLKRLGLTVDDQRALAMKTLINLRKQIKVHEGELAKMGVSGAAFGLEDPAAAPEDEADRDDVYNAIKALDRRQSTMESKVDAVQGAISDLLASMRASP